MKVAKAIVTAAFFLDTGRIPILEVDMMKVLLTCACRARKMGQQWQQVKSSHSEKEFQSSWAAMLEHQ